MVSRLLGEECTVLGPRILSRWGAYYAIIIFLYFYFYFLLVWYCAVPCCAVLCRAVPCRAVPCCPVLCCTCCAVLSCAVLCCAVLCCAVPCRTVLCCTLLSCLVFFCFCFCYVLLFHVSVSTGSISCLWIPESVICFVLFSSNLFCPVPFNVLFETNTENEQTTIYENAAVGIKSQDIPSKGSCLINLHENLFPYKLCTNQILFKKALNCKTKGKKC